MEGMLQPRWDWAGSGGHFAVLFQPSAENLGYFALLLSAGVWQSAFAQT